MPMNARAPGWLFWRRIVRAIRSRLFLISEAVRILTGLNFFIGDANDGIQEELSAETDIFRVRPFERTVAYTAAARNEKHCRGRDLRHLHCVMASSRRHYLVGNAARFAAFFEKADEAAIERHGIFFADRQNIDAES